MDGKKDILADYPELKNLPFEVPEGYFEGFNVNLHPEKRQSSGVFRKISPYIAIAAMFVIIASVGTLILETMTPEDERNEYISWLYTDLVPYTQPESLYNPDIVVQESLSEEDVIDYLIYSGIDLTAMVSE